jgi:hypothetical protein
MIDYSLICPVPPVLGAVVIVDPFSTGANLAAMVSDWGYKVQTCPAPPYLSPYLYVCIVCVWDGLGPSGVL